MQWVRLHITAQRGRRWYAHHRIVVHYVLLAGVALLVVVIAGQMFYPYGRILPGVSIDGRSVGGQTTTGVAHSLERSYDDAAITLRAGDHEATAKAKYIGIEIVAGPTADAAAEYKLSERLIPFSFFTRMKTNVRPILRFDDQRLAEFAREVSQKASADSKNAGIAIAEGKVTLIAAKPGQTYRISDIMQQLHAVRLQPKTTVTIRPVVTKPLRDDKSVQPVLAAAQKIVDTPLKLQIATETITIEKKVLASWIELKESSDGMQLELVTKQDMVKAYLQDLQSRINKTPGTTNINLVDGQTVSRTDGVAGFGVDVEKSTALIMENLASDKPVLTLPLVSLPAIPVYNRTYTDTQKGLDALVRDVAAAKGNASMVVMELDGQLRQSRVAGDKVWPAASMYKIYVAYSVLQQVSTGDMKWTDEISYGKDASACFESMIVISDNVCAAAFGDTIGWSKIEQMVHAIGLSGTTLTPAKYTTANDLALFLTKLHDGSLLPSGDRAKLLDVMRRQIYKAGIPTGAGAAAANKVGYVWGVRHDAGIVYASGGTYIEVIMTNGLEWPSIADAARQINTFLNK